MQTNSQEPFPYDERTLATIEKYVSSERLAAYMSYARGDKWVAVRLYERNTEISEALYGVDLPPGISTNQNWSPLVI